MASTAQARAVLEQGRHRAVRVVAEGELLGVAEGGQHPLPRRGRVEQQQPPHPRAGGRLRLALARHHDEVDRSRRGRPAPGSPARSGPRTSTRRSPAGHRSPTAADLFARWRRRRATSVAAPGRPAAPAGRARSLPLPSTRPAPSSTANVIRRWSGTRSGANCSGGTCDAGAGAQHPGELVGQPPVAAGLGLREGGGRVVRRRDEVHAGGLGQRPQQGRRELLAQPRHLPVEARRRCTWLSTCTGMWTVTPSAAAPGSNW